MNRRHLLKSVGTASLAAGVPVVTQAVERESLKPTIIRTHDLMQSEPNQHLWHLHQTAISRTNLVEMRGRSTAHIHPDAAHSLYLISGEAKATVGGEEFALRAGDFISIPAGVVHGYTVAEGKTALFISMDSPPYDPAKTKLVK